jgi:molybdopterin/thiamine biosynthesis adenylyltransferase
MLTDRDKQRYARQMIIDGWGAPGQEKLKRSTVFVAGAGGLGSPASIYLAVAGVGRIVLCDCDSPELSNLNRQILHSDARLGINKAVSGKVTLAERNPDIEVIALTERIDAGNVERLTNGANVILDCLDNFDTRFVLNQHAAGAGIPLVHGSVYGMEGRVTFIHPPETPCLLCLYPEGPPREVFPIVGATPGIAGCIQALEALKYLLGTGSTLKGRLLSYDGLTMTFSEYKLAKAIGCPVCACAA